MVQPCDQGETRLGHGLKRIAKDRYGYARSRDASWGRGRDARAVDYRVSGSSQPKELNSRDS